MHQTITTTVSHMLSYFRNPAIRRATLDRNRHLGGSEEKHVLREHANSPSTPPHTHTQITTPPNNFLVQLFH